jgi:hypothetical protein
LGYPLKLVKAKGDRFTHLFARWDELDGPRFNIEATAEGLSCHPDDYYRTGRYQASARLENRTNLLKSATPREELAEFINQRGWCWLDAGKHRQAVDCFAWACALMPGDDLQLRSLECGADPWREELLRQMPCGFPPVTIDFRSRRYPDTLPVHIEREIIHLETLENLLGDPIHERNWWQPLRNGLSPVRRLNRITVRYENDMSHVSMSYSSEPRGPMEHAI